VDKIKKTLKTWKKSLAKIFSILLPNAMAGGCGCS